MYRRHMSASSLPVHVNTEDILKMALRIFITRAFDYTDTVRLLWYHRLPLSSLCFYYIEDIDAASRMYRLKAYIKIDY